MLWKTAMSLHLARINSPHMNLNIRRVTSIHLPEFEPYLTLKRPLRHREQGFFVAEGEKVVRRLLESRLRIISLLLTEEWLQVYRPLLESRTEMFEIYLAEKQQMEAIVGFQLHMGVMAVGEIPEGETVEQILARSKRPYFLVAVDGIMNAENLGVIVRNCASFGVHAILVGETSCDPYLRRAVRNSMGNVFSMPVVRLSNIAEDLPRIRSLSGSSLIAAHPRETSHPITKVNFRADCCIVFGSEGDGISKRVLDICDVAATIPMNGGVDSINVASASAVAFYEVQRQRSLRET